MPGIEALELPWMKLIAPGFHVKEEFLPVFLAELDKLKDWVDQNVKDHFLTRAKLLEDKLPTAFLRKDAVVFIG
jgi:hypothetical protein